MKGFYVTEMWALFNGISCVCAAGQVDWAALAQAWIAQKESSTTTMDQPQQQQPNGQDNAGLDSHNNHSAFQNDSSFNRMWQPGM